ncbi:MAG: hypothetical protein J6Y60_07950 [Treponema sp.]|nr:hypothetical protein [Treponema sp.]
MKAYTLNRDRYRDTASEFFSKWMELNFCITLVTACKFGGYGTERANRLFHEIRKEMARFNEYNDYEYSMKELNEELERLGIPIKTGHMTSQGAFYDLSHRDKMTKKNQAAASIAESKEMAEKLKLMKELM